MLCKAWELKTAIQGKMLHGGSVVRLALGCSSPVSLIHKGLSGYHTASNTQKSFCLTPLNFAAPGSIGPGTLNQHGKLHERARCPNL